jgi:hypothetical protein
MTQITQESFNVYLDKLRKEKDAVERKANQLLSDTEVLLLLTSEQKTELESISRKLSERGI